MSATPLADYSGRPMPPIVESLPPLAPDEIEDAIGATLSSYLVAVEAFLVYYVAFPSEHEPTAIALWVAHAHLVDQFETSPILAITSAEKQSGKTRLLDCLELLVPHPFRCVIPSEAVTYTVLSQRPRQTMLLDEADAIFGARTAERYEGLRAILNAGNRQGTPVLRVKLEGRRREVEAFDVYGPKAIAGIGKLPDTVADRAIPIRMKRRAPNEPVARFRRRTAEREAATLRMPDVDVALVADVPVPEELPDRAADGWEPLLALADAAGDEWPVRARIAAIALSSEIEVELSVGVRLLADVRDVFAAHDHLATVDLLAGLHDLDDAPWGEWYGKPLTARGLAKLLEPFGAYPLKKRHKDSKDTFRGYFRSEFEDVWRRYLPAPATATTATTATEQVSLQLDLPGGEGDAASRNAPDSPALPRREKKPEIRTHREQGSAGLPAAPSSPAAPIPPVGQTP